jgi:membrane dipeptidase
VNHPVAKTQTSDREDSLAQARQMVADSIFYDLLYAPGPGGLAGELALFEKAGVSAVSLTAAADDESWPTLIFKKLAEWRHYLSLNPDRFVIVDNIDDFARAKRDKKLAVSFHFQGTEAVGRHLPLVGAYVRLGVRSMLMAYNRQNNVGMGCIEALKHDYGLTEFGRELVAEMNRSGMIVDCSHSGHRTTMDAMQFSSKPVIFSHSNAHALYAHPRNIKDDQIKACAATGGFVGINGVGSFNGDIHEVNPETVFRHIDYMVELVGADHVALGLDYMTPELCDLVITRYKGDLTRVGMSAPPWGFLSPLRAVEVVALMVEHGYSKDAIRGILGENYLRVARACW